MAGSFREPDRGQRSFARPLGGRRAERSSCGFFRLPYFDLRCRHRGSRRVDSGLPQQIEDADVCRFVKRATMDSIDDSLTNRFPHLPYSRRERAVAILRQQLIDGFDVEASTPQRGDRGIARQEVHAIGVRSTKDALADEEDRQRCSTVRKGCLRIQEAISHRCNRRCQRQQRLTNGYSSTADVTMSGVFSFRSANRSAIARRQKAVDERRVGGAVLVPRQG